ncbi:MAG: response regulator [Gammaproteobacteria bacterium]|nr:response regulator [Gammaproteobacteria bacterium]
MDIEQKSDKIVTNQLVELQQRFSEQLPARMAVIQEGWLEVCREPDSKAGLDILCRNVHNLAGSAGSFGAANISRQASELEKLLTDESGHTTQEAVERALGKLETTIKHWLEGKLDTFDRLQLEQYSEQFNSLVYLVEDDEALAQQIIGILSRIGYQVEHFVKVQDFLVQCSANGRPGVIIMDMLFEDDVLTGADAIQQTKQHFEPVPPVIFISVRDDVASRLAAVRAGAIRYLPKPLNFNKLCQTVDGLTGRLLSSPYRVLYIDDDPDSLDFHASLMQGAGFEVKTLSQPLQALLVMETFQPDLILMDVYMPDCSGLELAAMIRQDDRWVNLPLVFLSSESNIEKKMGAMDLGGDDFISKPVEPYHFINALKPRLRRTRWIRRLNNELQETLRRSEYQRIALDKHSIVSITDARGKITEVNDKFIEISGYARDELLGRNHRLINSGYHPEEFFHEMWLTISQGMVWHGLIRNRKKNGEYYWVDSTIVPFLDDQGIPYQYVSVRTDVTLIKEAEAQLTHAKEVAERANQAKSRFLASMSHELRTPLNAILGYSQLLRSGVDNELDEDQEKGIGEIEKAGWHLLRLIDDILELPKIEAGVVKINIEPVHLMPVIMECEALILPQVQENNLSLQLQIDPCRDRVVEADYTRLTQVILNLLSNACKYNRPDGQITISCDVIDERMIRISVEDTGLGIAEKYHPEVFSSFNRLGAEDSGISGTGVGLNICRQLMQLMGGEIGFHSVVDEGSCFWIDVPLSDI